MTKTNIDIVGIVEDSVEFTFGDIIRKDTDSIGTSDINCVRNDIKRRITRINEDEDYNKVEVSDIDISRMISKAIRKIENEN
tara:strand:- start:215 stop:460 length:246 start_codon:yes stop_codon:yes gene_type:complete